MKNDYLYIVYGAVWDKFGFTAWECLGYWLSMGTAKSDVLKKQKSGNLVKHNILTVEIRKTKLGRTSPTTVTYQANYDRGEWKVAECKH